MDGRNGWRAGPGRVSIVSINHANYAILSQSKSKPSYKPRINAPNALPTVNPISPAKCKLFNRHYLHPQQVVDVNKPTPHAPQQTLHPEKTPYHTTHPTHQKPKSDY